MSNIFFRNVIDKNKKKYTYIPFSNPIKKKNIANITIKIGIVRRVGFMLIGLKAYMISIIDRIIENLTINRKFRWLCIKDPKTTVSAKIHNAKIGEAMSNILLLVFKSPVICLFIFMNPIKLIVVVIDVKTQTEK